MPIKYFQARLQDACRRIYRIACYGLLKLPVKFLNLEPCQQTGLNHTNGPVLNAFLPNIRIFIRMPFELCMHVFT